MPGTVAVYFVASPLQYLAAGRIAERLESGSGQVLLCFAVFVLVSALAARSGVEALHGETGARRKPAALAGR
jgi:hypothetical protein